MPREISVVAICAATTQDGSRIAASSPVLHFAEVRRGPA